MKTICTVHVIVQRSDGKILLLRRAQSRTSPGKWNCITGFIQDHETAEDAAVRELKEETNLEGVLVKSGEPFWKDNLKSGLRKIYIPSFIAVDDISILTIDKSESDDYKWVDLNDPYLEEAKSLFKSLQLLGLK